MFSGETVKKQAGFTIVELVVVIALLGILAAVALPRFLNVTDDAHAASVNGTAGAFRSAVGLVKAQAVVEQAADNDTVDYDGASVTVNGSGYPKATSAATCVSTWQNILQAGAPTVAEAAGSDYLAEFAGGVCTYTYQAASLSITYTPATGTVGRP